MNMEAGDQKLCTVMFADGDRAQEVKEFDETKAGVKGLLDSGGLIKIPRIFIHPPENIENGGSSYSGAGNRESVQVPVIDLKRPREEVVNQIRQASETWGFFQMVNHGIPAGIQVEIIDSVRRFHEQPREVKMEWYSRDPKQKARFYCNGDLHVSKAANWRDSVAYHFDDGLLSTDALPLVSRAAVEKYMEQMMRVKHELSELLSEALDLSRDFLESIDCMRTATLVCHYYPFCPEPNLTLGATKHSDPSFLTILLQDDIGGLQVLHHGHWVDVQPIQGALIANIGDLMQLITNDRLMSVEHRVLSGQVGPRISAACFFYPSTANASETYGPLKEFISTDNPPKYRETHYKEYQAYYRSKGLDGTSALRHFML